MAGYTIAILTILSALFYTSPIYAPEVYEFGYSAEEIARANEAYNPNLEINSDFYDPYKVPVRDLENMTRYYANPGSIQLTEVEQAILRSAQPYQGEPIPIYRGGNNPNGLSWTTDPSVARGFADRDGGVVYFTTLQPGTPVVPVNYVREHMNTEDIGGYDSGGRRRRWEHEIILPRYKTSPIGPLEEMSMNSLADRSGCSQMRRDRTTTWEQPCQEVTGHSELEYQDSPRVREPRARTTHVPTATPPAGRSFFRRCIAKMGAVGSVIGAVAAISQGTTAHAANGDNLPISQQIEDGLDAVTDPVGRLLASAAYSAFGDDQRGPLPQASTNEPEIPTVFNPAPKNPFSHNPMFGPDISVKPIKDALETGYDYVSPWFQGYDIGNLHIPGFNPF